MNKYRRNFISIFTLAAGYILLPGCAEKTEATKPLKPLDLIGILDVKSFSGIMILNDLIKSGKFKTIKKLRSFELIRPKWFIVKGSSKLNIRIKRFIEKDFLKNRIYKIKRYEFSKTEIKLYQYILKHNPSYFDEVNAI